MATLRREQFEPAVGALRDQGGFSLNMRRGKLSRSGWFVARHSDQAESITPETATAEGLHQIANKHLDLMQSEGHMGGWLSGGEGMIESAHRYPNTRAGFRGAASDMHTRDQEAIFHGDTGNTYWNMDKAPDLGQFHDEHGEENRQTNMDQAQRELRAHHPKMARRAGLRRGLRS